MKKIKSFLLVLISCISLFLISGCDLIFYIAEEYTLIPTTTLIETTTKETTTVEPTTEYVTIIDEATTTIETTTEDVTTTNEFTTTEYITTSEGHVHSYVVEEVNNQTLKQAATCEAKAIYYYSCSCGEISNTLTFEYGDALGHSFTNYVSNGDATCTADGTKTATCDRCSKTDTVTDSGSKKNHSYQANVCADALKSEATCTSAAVYYKTCSCGKKSSTTFTNGEALGHSYGEYTVENDVHYRTCTRCGSQEEHESHSYTCEVITNDYIANSSSSPVTYYYSCICGKCGTKTFNKPTLYDGYYDNLVSWTDSEDLISQLHDIISNSYALEYEGNWESNRDADQSLYDFEMYDPVYTSELIPKSSTATYVNREHAFCASLMTGSSTSKAVEFEGRATDFLNLFASGTQGNTSRGNKNYGYADSSLSSYKDYTTNNGQDGYKYDVNNFEPGNVDKGRLARAIFYMCVMYNTSCYDSENKITMQGLTVQEDYVTYVSGNSCAFSIGNLSDLLEWSSLYSVDRLEYQHNESVYSYVYNGHAQGNRNPFVDYPELVEYCFGSKKNEAGTLSSLTSSYESLEISRSSIHNYAIESAPRQYDLNEAIDFSDIKIVAVKYNFDLSYYTNFTIKDENGNAITDGYVFSEGGTHTLTIVTPLNEIQYTILVETDPIEHATYSTTLPGNDKSSAFYSILTSPAVDHELSFSNDNYETSNKYQNVTWIMNYSTSKIGAANANLGTQFGTGTTPTTNLTFTTKSSISNITGIYFRGGCASKKSMTVNIYVNDVLKGTYTLTFVDSSTPLNAYLELDEAVSGKIKIEVVNSVKGAIYVKNIAFSTN